LQELTTQCCSSKRKFTEAVQHKNSIS